MQLCSGLHRIILSKILTRAIRLLMDCQGSSFTSPYLSQLSFQMQVALLLLLLYQIVKPFGKKRRGEQQAGQQRETNWKWQHRTSIVLLNRHILRGIIENYLLTLYSIHYTTTTRSCDILFLLLSMYLVVQNHICIWLHSMYIVHCIRRCVL